MADSNDARPEQTLRVLMLGGGVFSAAALVAGLAWYLAGGAAADAMLTIGLVTLMLTPALRVALAVVEALRARDWFFVATTLAVVVLLGLTLVVALSRLGERSRQPAGGLPAGGRADWGIDSLASRSR